MEALPHGTSFAELDASVGNWQSVNGNCNNNKTASYLVHTATKKKDKLV